MAFNGSDEEMAKKSEKRMAQALATSQVESDDYIDTTPVMVNKFCRRSKRHFLVHDIFDVALNNQSLNGVDNNCKTEYNFQLYRQQIDDS